MADINLLPPKRRKELVRRTVYKALSVFVHHLNFSLLLMTVIGMGAGAILWVSTVIGVVTVESSFDEAVRHHKELREQVVEQNAVLREVAQIGMDRIVWSALLQNVFDAVPSGVSVEALEGTVTLTREHVPEAGELVIDGRAVTRSTLTIFQARLEDVEGLDGVEAPTSNLLERVNPRYSLQAQVATP